MLTLEVLFLASLILAVALSGRLRSPMQALLLAALPGLLMVAHLLVEKPRWQMIPLYLLGLLIIGLTQAGRPARLPGKIGLGVLVALGAALPLLAPIDSLPQPSGPYQVGTVTFDWTDPSRPEIYTPDTADSRRILVQVWYPADVKFGAARAPYLPNSSIIQSALADFIEMPAFMLGHLGQIRTHSFIDQPAGSGERFPVLVFSHGWRGMRQQNTFQMEELASRGYVVFSADHTFGAITTVFPDGRVVPYNPDALPSGVSVEAYDQAARRLGQAWAGDIRFIFDQAARLDSGELASPLAGRLDLTEIGVFGHSTGGGAAIEACWLDTRCKAALVMDPWMVPYDRQIPKEGLTQPTLLMFSENWSANRNPPLVDGVLQHAQSDAYAMILAGTQHTSFSDLPLFLPLLSRIQTGSLFSATPQELVNTYSVAFFDKYLKGAQPDLLQPQAAPLPGVIFTHKGK